MPSAPIAAVEELRELPTAVGTARLFRCRCPMPVDQGARIGWLLEGAFGAVEKPDLFVTVAARGLYEDVARNRFAWAEIDGRMVSAAWTMTPADDTRIGSLGEVWTEPEFRGHGLAPAVCAALLDAFDAEGGRWMFLGTSNPSAARIYRGLGFERYPEGLMRRVRPVDSTFEDDWFAASSVRIRPIHWGDVPRIVALYSTPNPWLSISMMEGLFSPSAVIHNRCNSLVKSTWQATRGGAWLGLVNAEGALVGSGALEPRGNEREPIGGELDLFVHPAFAAAAGELLDALIGAASERGWRWLLARLGEEDRAKIELLTAAGFHDIGRLEDGLSIGGRTQAIRLLRLDLAGRQGLMRRDRGEGQTEAREWLIG